MKRPTDNVSNRKQSQSAKPTRFDLPSAACQSDQLLPSKMVMPTDFLARLLIVGVAITAPEEKRMDARKTEAEILSVQPTEEARMRTA
jgi:hypothetical protein